MFDINDVRNDFPMIRNNPNLIYFDSSATSFKPDCVIDAVVDYYSKYNTNIHRGDYDLAFKVDSLYDNTRNLVKEFINAESSDEIVFTSGATASLNLVAYGYGLKYLKKDDVVLLTQSEHASNILPWFDVSKKTGCKIEYIPLNTDGSFDLNKFEESFKDNVKIVAFPSVSNVLGYLNPVKKIIEIAHKHNALVSVDGAQSVPHVNTDVKDLDCDFLSFSSHKMCGPSGVGVLYAKKSILDTMDPLSFGGGSNARFDADGNVILKPAPYKFESGTPNIEGVIGLGAAVKYLNSIGMNNIYNYVAELNSYFMNRMKELDNVTVYNPLADSGIVSFNINGIFAQDAASYLNKQNIAVRTGNHCAKIIHNIICSNETIRASFYFYNTKEEIDRFVDTVKETTLEKCLESVL